MRDFKDWLASMRASINNYDYYVDFDKVYENTEAIKIELNIMNSLIGSKNIEADFRSLMERYPEILRCIPTLLAVSGRIGRYFSLYCPIQLFSV